MKPSSTSARLAELNFLEENLWRSCVFLNVSLEIVCHREHEIARITLEYSSLDSLVRNMAFRGYKCSLQRKCRDWKIILLIA